MFELDEAKSAATLRKCGFGFAAASEIFTSPHVEFDDERFDYGERRICVIGYLGAELLSVIFTWRGEARRIISVRKASRKERDVYRQIYP